ncbi:P-type conjugative transfer protein TrbJ [Aquitalea palustris]|uniref:P-type conjugative transfer protein TrbJ n=1 Tax=Aquitalea palustris TaxID=2480983 RepID=UPI001CF06CA1|nr:P-type conjugative transfer protein TrbJ [Aquitalea palustris]
MKKLIRKNSLAIVLMAAAIAGPAQAGTVAGFGGSTEVTQILNNVELITQTAQQVSQTEQQVKMVQIQLQQALTNPNTPWSQTVQSLQNLRNAVQKGQAIGYQLSGLEQQFKNTYRGYGQSSGNLLNDFIRWNNTTRDSIQGALTAAGMTVDQINSESGMIDNLRAMGQSAQGQMQAAQVGNAISIEMVQQMRQLRQLQAAQMQAHNAYLAGDNEQKAATRAANDSIFNVRKTKITQ